MTKQIRRFRWLAGALVLGIALLVGLPNTAQAAADTSTVAAPVEAPAQSGVYYTVQRGDTLSAIARRYGTTVSAIAQANYIGNTNRIYVGQRLYIPGGSYNSGSSYPVTYGHYIVQRGDTVSRIASRYNTTVAAIASANGLGSGNYIYVGQRLSIPSGYVQPPSVYGFNYTVTYGDTLSQIAARYGITLSQLAAANGIGNTNYIYVGQHLRIP